ncbi:HAMP domain-containing protein [Roseiflexus sp.]|uniref:HAMP domain-containing protein n=1 Tax=Roseiflexus sp. TaxID=2562120 RepID=UPI00398ACF77
MSWNLSRKTGVLAAGYLIILGILAMDLVFTVLEIQKVADRVNQAVLRDVQTVETINLDIQRVLTEYYSYIQTGDPDEYVESTEILENLEGLVKDLHSSTSAYSDFHETIVQKHALLMNQTEAVVRSVQRLHAQLPSTPHTLTDGQKEAFYEELETIEEQREAFAQRAHEYFDNVSTVARQYIAQDVTLTFAGVALALAAMVAFTAGAFWLIDRRVVRPLRQMTDAANMLAEGRLDGQLAVTSNDEIGILQQTFNRMTATIQQQTSDLETHYRQIREARDALEATHRQTVEQLAVIQKQQEAIRELSVPVLPVSRDTLVMPLVGVLDSMRLIQVQEQALERITATRARRLLLDITGVPIVDSHVAQGLIHVVQAARLLGTDVTLIGIRPEVAQSIVGSGIDLRHIRTCSDLQSALTQKGERS